MGKATSAAASPRFTALGASFGLRLPPFLGADFFFAAIFGLLHVAEDDARGARVGEIGPGPVDQHYEPAAEPDQEINVQQQPEPPGEDPGELESRQLRNRGMAANGGERAPVRVTEFR